MRLRAYNATTTADAMAQIRQDCGDDAIIVSTEDTDTGIRVVVAIEEAEEDVPNLGAVSSDPTAYLSGEDPIDVVHEALMAHGLPNKLIERLVDASFLVGADDAVESLAGALRQTFLFHPVQPRKQGPPIMLIGSPGAGKTITVAKLAARAVLAKKKLRLITTDTVRAGGIEQLEAFARLMKVPMQTAENETQLARLISAAPPEETVLIDTPGVNPYSAPDMKELAGCIRATGADAMLVSAAGGDVVDSMEQAEEFAQLGCSRMIVTRLDMVRRLGGMLAAADAASLPFSESSATATIVDGLATVDPISLARLILSDRTVKTSATPVPSPVFQGFRS